MVSFPGIYLDCICICHALCNTPKCGTRPRWMQVSVQAVGWPFYCILRSAAWYCMAAGGLLRLFALLSLPYFTPSFSPPPSLRLLSQYLTPPSLLSFLVASPSRRAAHPTGSSKKGRGGVCDHQWHSGPFSTIPSTVPPPSRSKLLRHKPPLAQDGIHVVGRLRQ